MPRLPSSDIARFRGPSEAAHGRSPTVTFQGEWSRSAAVRPAGGAASGTGRLTASPRSRCPGCGLVLPYYEGPAHPYLGASPACWAVYCEVLAREYGDPAYFRPHQLTVDTYAVQHPGAPERRTIQSLALHLITLCLVLERGADPAAGPNVHRRLAGRAAFHWLAPPAVRGRLTVADVRRARTAAEHAAAVEEWARDVWAAWKPHHAAVRGWIEQQLGASTPRPSGRRRP